MASLYRKYFYDKNYNDTWNIQIATGHKPLFDLTIEEVGDDHISLMVACYLFIAIGIRVKNKTFWKILRKITGDKYVNRELRIAFHDSTIWWNIFTNDDKSYRHRGLREGNFSFINFIRGKESYHKVYNEERVYDLPMPEGSYKCLIQQFTSYWNYQRFNYFFKKSMVRYDCQLGYVVDKCPENPKDFHYFREKGQLEWKYDYDNNTLVEGKEYEYFINKPMEDTSKPKWDDSSTLSITGYHQAKSLNEAASLFLGDLFKSRLTHFGNNHKPKQYENKM